MFDHSESWEFSAPDAETIARESEKYWEFAGFEVVSSSGPAFQGRCWSEVFGIVRTLEVRVAPVGTGGVLHLRYHVGTLDASARSSAVPRRAVAYRVPGGPKTPWEICEEDWERDRLAFWKFLVDTLGANPTGVADAGVTGVRPIHAGPVHLPEERPQAWPLSGVQIGPRPPRSRPVG